ncbi:Biopolymer transport protein ExbD [Robiginitalea myxolifaciens]|uniref:Biopolymer transport protein ExbD n=1 Tax=Robiginitalea myxolifaciens TaxID=400055 RepID=A0A1I6FUC3_9FLAO|nr:biopolymer transporter ExbD [Robiginitalea myxolifaciens]SFR33486.1 Biopolymer transport protein ExbD [Robiginitalea myxolifaciens]
MRNRANTEVNAGSMADIAFLLLIFFLVTTTIETDAGIDRLLPRIDDTSTIVVRQRNILTVNINNSGALLVEEELLPLEELKDVVIAFLDNGGDGSCDYCKGNREETSSDNPNIAIVSLRSDRQTAYADYIAVQNEITAGYNTLRNREAQRLFGSDYTALEQDYLNPQTGPLQKEQLKAQILQIQELFPLNLSEAETASE